MMTTKIVVQKLFVSGAYYAQMGEGRGEPKIAKRIKWSKSSSS